MLLPPRRRRKPLRLIQAPLPDGHPDWLDLDREVPNDHLARRLRCLVEAMDLSGLFGSFAGVGSAITPPDLLLQFVLFEIQRKRLSPAQWFLDARESIPARWLLRGLRPARCVLYRFRMHLPPDLVVSLNQQVLLLALNEGHTDAAGAALDGTFHAAYGSRHRLLNSATLDERCAQLDAAIAQDQGRSPLASSPASPTAPPTDSTASTPPTPLTEPTPATAPPPAPITAPPAPAPALPETMPGGPRGAPATTPQAEASPAGPPLAPVAAAAATGEGGAAQPVAGPAAPPGPEPGARPGWMAPTPAGRKRQQKRYHKAQKKLQQQLQDHDRKQRRQRKAQRRPAARVKISPSEPEAALGKDKSKVFRPLYNTQILQDLDSPFVLGYDVYARVTDAGLLPPLVERGAQLTGQTVKVLLADGIYGRLLDVKYCRQHDILLYAPVGVSNTGEEQPGQGKGQRKKKDKGIGKEQFVWLAEEHTYRCPQGHVLELERIGKENRREGEQVNVEQYRCAAEHCQACPLAARCTKRPDKGRTIKRLQEQELLDEVGQRMQSPEGRQLYKKRSQTVELCHADFRAHRGLDRFPSYGLAAAQSLIGLLVLVHNGLALLNARVVDKKTQKCPLPLI